MLISLFCNFHHDVHFIVVQASRDGNSFIFNQATRQYFNFNWLPCEFPNYSKLKILVCINGWKWQRFWAFFNWVGPLHVQLKCYFEIYSRFKCNNCPELNWTDRYATMTYSTRLTLFFLCARNPLNFIVYRMNSGHWPHPQHLNAVFRNTFSNEKTFFWNVILCSFFPVPSSYIKLLIEKCYNFGSKLHIYKMIWGKKINVNLKKAFFNPSTSAMMNLS